MGFPSDATIRKIFEKAEELGLELCPPETGPQLRKQYLGQPLNDRFNIGMKPITPSDGNPRVFSLACREDGLRLSSDWALPGSMWTPGSEFVFRLRPPKADKQVFPET